MKFTIATPSFRNSEWLKLCIASVADQKGVELEHIVHDAGSDDGTLDWLPSDSRVTAYVEKDNGMYDAINRAWKKSTGDILAYVNCDEQYLPGALKHVHDYFEAHPEVDAVIADAIVTDAEGNYLCHRVSVTPTPLSVWVRFNVLTCSLFIRRRFLEENNLYFDTKWRDLGDAQWVVSAIKAGIRFGELPVITSIFAETGANMNLLPNAVREKAEHHAMAPAITKVLKPLFLLSHWVKTATRVNTWLAPFDYALYCKETPAPCTRVTKQARKPTASWVGRSPVAWLVKRLPIPGK